jgi:quinol monooxygenase YgiN
LRAADSQGSGGAGDPGPYHQRMTEPVAFISRFRIKPGQRAAYEQLAAEVTPRIQAEWPRTLVYLQFIGPGEELTIIHVFGDAEAMDIHAERAKAHSPRAMALFEPLGWEIYGKPGAATRLALESAAKRAGVALREYPEFTSGFLRLSPKSEP